MDVLYNINLLYPTDVPVSPGIISVEIYKPQSGRLPICIKALDKNDPKKHITNIAKIIQQDLLKRINVDILTQVDLYIIEDQKRYHVYFSKSIKDFKLEEE